MVSANEAVREILDTLDGVKVTFYHPEQFNDLPVVSYYELITTTGFCYDNAEREQSSNMQIDIWGRGGGECDRIAVRVDRSMQGAGWYREMSRDMPPETHVYHKTMRYSKGIVSDGQ